MINRSEKNKEIAGYLDFQETKEKATKVTFIILKILLIIFILLFSLFLYMRYIATTNLITKEYRVIDSALPDNFNGLKIVHISDLYYKSSTTKEKLTTLVKQINKIKPDIIVFTGDLVDTNTLLTDEDKEDLISAFNNMHAKVDKYTITGDKDSEDFNYIISNTDFVLLENDYELIYAFDLTPILITGISNKSDIQKSFSYYESENNNKFVFNIVIMHKPDLIEEIIQYNPNIVLAGHSLNGSIKLPFIGGILKPSGAKSYYDEYYTINNTKLYISGGIGTNNNKLRLFNRPSFNFYRLNNK